MELATTVDATSIACPAISAGIYDCPLTDPTRIAIEGLTPWSSEISINLVAFTPRNATIMRRLLPSD